MENNYANSVKKAVASRKDCFAIKGSAEVPCSLQLISQLLQYRFSTSKK